jgi:RNA polymerase sigma-70 factor (ECF subfamily)
VGGGVSDEQLMIRVTTGDMEALGVLFERYKGPLYGFLYRLLHDVAWAEDLTLDVFLRVYDRRRTYKPGFKFSTWLFTIAHNLAADGMRQANRGEITLQNTVDDVSSSDPSPPDAVARGELAEVVRLAVLSLPEDQRLVILLREFQGFSYREIAQVLGAGEDTVRVRAHRARQALRKALAPYCEENSAAAVTFLP